MSNQNIVFSYLCPVLLLFAFSLVVIIFVGFFHNKKSNQILDE